MATNRFSTRQYAWRPRGVAADAAQEPTLRLTAGVLHRFRLGRDPQPVPMADAEISVLLKDPFASLLIRRGKFPLTLQTLLDALNEVNVESGSVRDQQVFMVAEGGQIAWTEATATLDRQTRVVVARGASPQLPTLFVSTSTDIRSESTFLQVLAWDQPNGVFQWYDRRGGTWIWAGNSWDALASDTRGQGPFDSHVNGSLNMKELKAPWIHWHSQDASIGPEAFGPDDPFVKDPLYSTRSGAQVLEKDIVRPSIRQWNDARFRELTKTGSLQRLPEAFRHVLETTTINLVASSEQSSQLQANRTFVLPTTLFLDSDALLDELELLDDLDPVEVDGGVYLENLQRFAVELRDEASGFRRPGDAFFAAVVPERAFEDQIVLQALLAKGVLSKRLAACLLMIDFPNPIFSPRRAALLKYVPASAKVGDPPGLERALVGAVTQAANGLGSDSAEVEFLKNSAIPEAQWRDTFARRIQDFMTAVRTAVTDPNRFPDIFQLIDSRRREFRRRPLAEFRLTVPVSNIARDAHFLELTEDARLRIKE